MQVEVTAENLMRLSIITGERLSAAAASSGVSVRAIQTWIYHGVRPRPDMIGRVWNAMLQNAIERGISDVVRGRLLNELGVVV